MGQVLGIPLEERHVTGNRETSACLSSATSGGEFKYLVETHLLNSKSRTLLCIGQYGLTIRFIDSLMETALEAQ